MSKYVAPGQTSAVFSQPQSMHATRARLQRLHGRKSLHFTFDVLQDRQATEARVRIAARRAFRKSLELTDIGVVFVCTQSPKVWAPKQSQRIAWGMENVKN